MILFDSLRTILLLMIFLCVAPLCITSIKQQYAIILEPPTQIGILTICKQLNTSSHVTEQLHSFFKNSLIKGIIITIDCADSALASSQLIFHDIRQLKKDYPKPIITLIENSCLAGAYLIASACDYIIAPESATIGSIGQQGNADELLIKQIASSRKLSLATTHTWADGNIFTGTQALALGLINEIGSMYTAIKIMKEKALIEGEIECIDNSTQQSTLHIFFGNKGTIA